MWPVLATRDDALATLEAVLAVRGPNPVIEALRADRASDEEAAMVQFEDQPPRGSWSQRFLG